MPPETNEPIEQSDLTPPEAEQTGTTPTDAVKSETTPPDAESKSGEFDADAVEKIVKRRLDRERKKWEQEREEAEERARMSEAERLQADLQAKQDALTAAEKRAVNAERLAALTGKVADPKAALRLLDDDHLTEDGTVNVDALLNAYPFLAPQAQPKPSANSAVAPTPARGKAQAEDLESAILNHYR